jgi:DNA-binding transcriptional MerR regulator
MQYPEERKLFTVKDVSRACGISRATLLRMEESGFLTPFRVDPDSGYRYYDTGNIAAIGQYQWLQSAGLSRTEIADLYHGRIDSEKFLEEQRRKLEAMRRFVHEFELRYDRSKDHTLSLTTLPATTCYCAEIRGSSSFNESGMLGYLAHERCIAEGYRLLGSEPMSVLREDWSTWAVDPFSDYGFTICIPVVPGPGWESDQNLRHFPATEALSIIGFGDYSVIPGLWKCLLEEADARGLEPAGLGRLIGLVAPYVGDHVRPDEYCYECVIPIK